MKDSHAQASVDLETITGNVAALGAHVAPSAVMAVVKADGYGHGAVTAARAALRGGAQWLGVAHVAEALELRAAGIDSPLLCLMAIGEHAHREAISAGVDLSAGSVGMVRRLAEAGAAAGRPARVHLKADTGLSRGGATAADWPSVLNAALSAQTAGHLTVAGLWSHFASADEPGNPSVAVQLAAFEDALAVADKAGVTPEVRHIANTAAALLVPDTRYDLVRIGGGIYGVSTLPGGPPSWLRPALASPATAAPAASSPAAATTAGRRAAWTRRRSRRRSAPGRTGRPARGGLRRCSRCAVLRGWPRPFPRPPARPRTPRAAPLRTDCPARRRTRSATRALPR